jgi:hypothetical protein
MPHEHAFGHVLQKRLSRSAGLRGEIRRLPAEDAGGGGKEGDHARGREESDTGEHD